MRKMVTLGFSNNDATPRDICLNVASEDVEPIMAWYGAYYAGDDYTVFVDGKEAQKDHNGDLIPVTIDGCARRTAP